MTSDRYNKTAIALHWVLALALFYQIVLGMWMLEIPKSPPGFRAEWFNWHKSIGMSLGLVIVLRVLWRIKHGAPQWPSSVPYWQKFLAKSNHAVLYGCMFVMPLTGFLGSTFSPYPIKYFGIVIPKIWEASTALKDLMSTFHFGASRIFIVAIVLHLMASLWHSLKGEGMFSRMIPGKSLKA
jgi:cytochrome b561